jgi:hypothetical protein
VGLPQLRQAVNQRLDALKAVVAKAAGPLGVGA